MPLAGSLRKDNFRSGVVGLPELGVSVELEPHQFYNREEVEDICDRVRELKLGRVRSGHAYNIEPKPRECPLEAKGLVVTLRPSFSPEKTKGYITLVRKGLDRIDNTITAAQQDGRVLWMAEKEAAVYQQFKDPYCMRPYVHTEDDFANLCGFIALSNADYDVRTLDLRGRVEKDIEDAKAVRDAFVFCSEERRVLVADRAL
jgi:hypothetical protein